MQAKPKIVYYVNQFFGNIGGEDMASAPVQIKDEKVGPAQGFDDQLDGHGEVVRTIICGDNYFNENKESAVSRILAAIKESAPQIFIAGPAFNAGRYGMACAEISKAVTQELGIPAVTGMYIENPGVEVCRESTYIVSTTDSAGGMRTALPAMGRIAKALLAGEEIGSPDEMGYIPRGIRKTVFTEKRGSARAVEMLLSVLSGNEVETEMPMPVFDEVDPAPAIKDLSKATIALCTSGGIVPHGNPDRVESASAQKWAKYDVTDKKTLSRNEFYSTHGGYDTSYANEAPDRIAPLDILYELKEEGYIGDVFKYFYTTTGTGTSVSKAREFGQEIGAQLLSAGVDGVILTST